MSELPSRKSRLIVPLADLRATDSRLVGGKAANLGELVAAGLPVPAGFVVTTDAYRAATDRTRPLPADGGLGTGLGIELASAYAGLPGDNPLVAVRSSATAEDLPDASFAGQYRTVLGARGIVAVADAVATCWTSLLSDRIEQYRGQHGLAADDLEMGVVVQELVDAEAAGVMFTAHPTTGWRNVMVISAAWGLGEAVVDGTTEPDDIRVYRRGDQVKVGMTYIGDKTMRTNLRRGRIVDDFTELVEVPENDRKRAVLSGRQAEELAALGVRIEQHFGRPMDVEWAFADGRFWILQARPITALPDEVGETPTQWPVSDPHGLYARASIVEQLPDPLTPLFGDLIAPAVTGSLTALFSQAMRGLVKPGDLHFVRINGYAYYHYTRNALLRMSAGAVPLAMTGGLAKPEQFWRRQAHPKYRAVVDRWNVIDVEKSAAADLLAGVEELLYAGCEYYTCVQRIIPAAATSELTFTSTYEKTARRPGDPPAITFLLGGDSEPIRADQALFTLARWVLSKPTLAEAITRTVDADRLAFGAAAEGVSDADWTAWQTRLGNYLSRYGHAVYNLDFANPVAADTPAPVLATLRYYLTAGADSLDRIDPTRRQRRLREQREVAERALLARLDPFRRKVIRRMLRRAQQLGPLREDALADVGLGWPTARRLLRELGRRLHRAGTITEIDDVFWLTEEELRPLIELLDNAPVSAARDADPADHSYDEAVRERRATWRGQALATPPQLLPDTAVNHLMQRWMPQQSAEQTGDTLTGIGASGGRISGPAVVVRSPSDFSRMQPGMVLVARITTPAYTPLFALASAVVTDIGGPLSHSSIVAREYGIPAVLGTASATTRIQDGQRITVDGTRGVVQLDADAAPPPEVPVTPQATPQHRTMAGVAGVAGLAALIGGLAVVAVEVARRQDGGSH